MNPLQTVRPLSPLPLRPKIQPLQNAAHAYPHSGFVICSISSIDACPPCRPKRLDKPRTTSPPTRHCHVHEQYIPHTRAWGGGGKSHRCYESRRPPGDRGEDALVDKSSRLFKDFDEDAAESLDSPRRDLGDIGEDAAESLDSPRRVLLRGDRGDAISASDVEGCLVGES